MAQNADEILVDGQNETVPDHTTYGPDKYSEDGKRFRYLAFGCTVDYKYKSGKLQCPVAEAPSSGTPKPACVIVRTNAPVSKKRVTYYARRLGAQPLVPVPEPDDEDQVLLKARVVNAAPILDDSSTLFVYEVKAVYLYALLQPRTPDQGFPGATAPFTSPTPFDTFLKPENFVPLTGGAEPLVLNGVTQTIVDPKTL